MYKINYIFSLILIIIGIISLFITSFANQLMPKIGRVAFQTATFGTYNSLEYSMDFVFINRSSYFLIIIGIIFSIYNYKKEKQNRLK